jgi:hypothetical protein
MGRSSTLEDHIKAIEWAESLPIRTPAGTANLSLKVIQECYGYHLKQYFRLCGLARSKNATPQLAERAHMLIFRSRVAIERSIARYLKSNTLQWHEKLRILTERSIYGASKKQGVSSRMPLSSCTPTRLCAAGCYAHDVLDASPNAVVRGAINGWIAAEFESGTTLERSSILVHLEKHTKQAIKYATQELENLPEGFTRRPYIRFSHVGEIVKFPEFSNAIASQVISLSNGTVDCVVYTRSRTAVLLDPKLWVINFTLDPSSVDHISYAPPSARIVFSSFGGETSPIASVNFLEHHRHIHMLPKTTADRICPATLPETIDRTCDGCKCKTCFVPAVPFLSAQ